LRRVYLKGRPKNGLSIISQNTDAAFSSGQPSVPLYIGCIEKFQEKPGFFDAKGLPGKYRQAIPKYGSGKNRFLTLPAAFPMPLFE
jgi:hypothetical protein